MKYDKGDVRWGDDYSPRTMGDPDSFYLEGRSKGGRDLVIGGREEALALVAELLALVSKHAPSPWPSAYGVDTDSNTVRTKDGNVIAACGDRATAAYIAILLHRSDELAGQLESAPPFTRWKGPYTS